MSVRIGFIGTGGIARRQARTLAKMEDVEIVAACDINEEALADFAEKFEVPHTFKDFNELVKMEELDAVTVCTPNFMHKDPTVAALKAGKDVLVEKPMAMNAAEAQQMVDVEEARQLQEKLLSAEFDLEDFRTHLNRIRGMGPLDQLMKMIPGAAKLPELSSADIDERELDIVDAIVNSMTKEERRRPDIMNASRKRRIARGSGTTVQDVNIVLKQYRELSKMMQAMTQGKNLQIGGLQLGKY